MEEAPLVRDFAIIMAIAGTALVLFRQLGQPAVIGYLIAGLLLSPLNLPFSPVHNVETIRLLADLGLTLLLFDLGLEVGWHRIRTIGSRVFIIGGLEILFVLALGHEIGTLLGWSTTEAVFLGSALAISSSGILVKVLRDTGRLHHPRGRLIVGILIVEDLAAVILLTLLSGIASTGAPSIEDISLLVVKMGLFAGSALVVGNLVTPHIIGFVDRFHSDEALLIASLALCFGLALVGQQLGLSAAAGAFLIGAVLGDTVQADRVAHTMAPVRDVFAALFFVSIGMLVDLSLVAAFIGPAIAVSAAFILGKVLANTLGTFMVGEDGKTSLGVGLGMPQLGEFSLAMVKVGTDRGAVGPFLYPVVTLTVAITAFLYPFLFRSVDAAASFLDRRSPAWVLQYLTSLEVWLTVLRGTFSFRGAMAREIQRSGRLLLLNIGVIVAIVAGGNIGVRFVEELSSATGWSEELVGLVLAGSLAALAVPPAVAIARSLRPMTRGVARYAVRRQGLSPQLWEQDQVRSVLADTILVVVTLLLLLWSLPLLVRLIALGAPSTFVSAGVMMGVVVVVAVHAYRIQRVLGRAFSKGRVGSTIRDRQGDDVESTTRTRPSDDHAPDD